MNCISYWYCPNCKIELDGSHVTYEELCSYCGTEVLSMKASKERVEELLKAEAEGRLVVLPCKVGENLFVVSHAEKRITEIMVSEYSYSIWHDAWIVSTANGHQFFLGNSYRTRETAEKALGGGEG